MMNQEQADEAFGKVIYTSDNYEVRAKEKADGLHVYSLRRDAEGTRIPYGFVLGSNSLWHEVLK
jgi:hypothetical protein